MSFSMITNRLSRLAAGGVGALLALAAFGAGNASARVLFDDYFEVGDLYAWSSRSSTNVFLVSDPAYSGLGAFQSRVPDGSNFSTRAGNIIQIYCATGVAGPDPVYARFYFRLGADATAGTYPLYFATFGSSYLGGVAYAGVATVSNKLYLTTSKGGRGTRQILRDTWYCLELMHRSGLATNGELRLFLDGQSEVAVTNVALPAVTDLRLGISVNGPHSYGTVSFDNVVVSDQYVGPNPNEIKLAHAGFFGHLGMKIVAILSGTPNVRRFESVLEGPGGSTAVLFSTNGVPRPREEFTLNLRPLAAGDYTLVARALDAQGAVLAETRETFNKPYAGVPKVGINEHNAVCTNGVPVFPVTPFGLKDYLIPVWAQARYVNSLFNSGFGKAFTLTNYLAYLNQSAASGTLGAIGPGRDDAWAQTAAGGRVPTLSAIEQYVVAFRNHPGVFMWNWMDEPTTNFQQPPDLVRSWTERSHQLDPHHLVAVNEIGTVTANATDYRIRETRAFMYPNLVADIYAFDTYPIEYGITMGIKVSDLALINDRHEAWNYGLVPRMAFVETCDVNNSSTAGSTPYPPTPDQLRMLTWIHVVHGVKGINWFHYFTATPPQNYAVMSELTDHLTKLAPVVLGPPPAITVTDSSNTGGNRVDTMVRADSESVWVFAVRVTETNEAAPVTTTFTLVGADGVTNVVEPGEYAPTIHRLIGDPAQLRRNYFTALPSVPVRPGTLQVGARAILPKSPPEYQMIYLQDLGNGVMSGGLPGYPVFGVTGTVNYARGDVTLDLGRYAGLDMLSDPGVSNVVVSYRAVAADRVIPVTGGSFSDVFEPNAVHIYRFANSAIKVPAPPSRIRSSKR